jgi:hypothetical protein
VFTARYALSPYIKQILCIRHLIWRFNTGFFLKEMISHNQLPLNLILFQSYQVSAFMKPCSGSSYFVLGYEEPKPGSSEIKSNLEEADCN